MTRLSTSAGLRMAFACSFLLAMPAVGQVYKWTDAQGKVHYSDQPPPEVKQPVTVKPRSPAAPTEAPDAPGTPASAPKSYVEKDAEFNQRRVQAAEKAAMEKKAAKEAEEKKKNCELAKVQLARAQSGERITRYNEKGEIVYLSDSEVAQEAARTKQVADSWCK